jgi:hypothetical protein
MRRIIIITGFIIVVSSILAYIYLDSNKNHSKCVCEHKPYDKEDYLFKICMYVKEKKLDVSPADPCNYHIREIVTEKIDNKEVVVVYLDCCYLGGGAIFDKQTNDIIDFWIGDK